MLVDSQKTYYENTAHLISETVYVGRGGYQSLTLITI